MLGLYWRQFIGRVEHVFIWVLVGIIVVGVAWNIFQASKANSGVAFEVPRPPPDVHSAIGNAFLASGAKSRAKSMIRGVEVLGGTGSRYTYGTKYGDSGTIEIAPSGSGTRITARTNDLFVGWKRSFNPTSGFYQLVVALTHMCLRMVYYRPNAPKMRRFQSALERRITKELGRPQRAN